MLFINAVGMVYLYYYALPNIDQIASDDRYIACINYISLLDDVSLFVIVAAIVPGSVLIYCLCKHYFGLELALFEVVVSPNSISRNLLTNISLLLIMLSFSAIIQYGKNSFDCNELNSNNMINHDVPNSAHRLT